MLEVRNNAYSHEDSADNYHSQTHPEDGWE